MRMQLWLVGTEMKFLLIPFIKMFTVSKSVELLINSDTFISRVFCTQCVIRLNLTAGEIQDRPNLLAYFEFSVCFQVYLSKL